MNNLEECNSGIKTELETRVNSMIKKPIHTQSLRDFLIKSLKWRLIQTLGSSQNKIETQ